MEDRPNVTATIDGHLCQGIWDREKGEYVYHIIDMK